MNYKRSLVILLRCLPMTSFMKLVNIATAGMPLLHFSRNGGNRNDGDTLFRIFEF